MGGPGKVAVLTAGKHMHWTTNADGHAPAACVWLIAQQPFRLGRLASQAAHAILDLPTGSFSGH